MDAKLNDTANGRRVFKATVIVVATVAAAYMMYRLVDLLLILFACALVALILLTIANRLRRWVPMKFGVAVAVAVVLVFALIGGASWFFGASMREQFGELSQRLPAAWEAFQLRASQTTIGALIIDRAREFAPTGQTIVGIVTTIFSYVGSALSGLAIVLIGGLYLAAQPRLYVGGVLKLVPASMRDGAADTLDAIATSLRGWLKGQALGMAFVGVGTGVALGVVGVPAAAAIGLVAGLAEFVPYLGAVVAGVPAIILGFGVSTETGLWTIGALVIVQQLQGNLVMPLLQNQMVDLPPALTIFGIIASGILLGPIGVLLATPLTVVVLVLVRRLYLGEGKAEVLANVGTGGAAVPVMPKPDA